MATKIWNVKEEVMLSVNDTGLEILKLSNGENNLATIAMAIYKEHYEYEEKDIFKQIKNSNAYFSLLYDVLGYSMNLVKFDVIELQLNPAIPSKKEAELQGGYLSPFANGLIKKIAKGKLSFSRISEIVPEIIKEEGLKEDTCADEVNTELANLLLKGELVPVFFTGKVVE